MRAFAILAVMACHYYPLNLLFFKAAGAFGWAGVQFFFVLSGFLITTILLQLKTRPHPYKVFYARRVLRIFPPYYALMFLVVAISVFQHDSFSWLAFAGKAIFLQSFSHELKVVGHIYQNLANFHEIANPFLLRPLPPMGQPTPLPGFDKSFVPTWSLSVEEWFYLLWAPLVLHLRRKTLGYLCVTVCVAALLIRWLGFLGETTYFDFSSLIDVPLGGALLALWADHRRTLPVSAQRQGDFLLRLSTVCCLALLAALLWGLRPILGHDIRESLPFTVFGLPLLCFCFAGLLSEVLIHAGSGRMLNRLLRLKPFVAIGTISYTLYLIHVPIYYLMYQATCRLGLDALSYGPALAISLTSLVVSIGVAAISFRYFEAPILALKDKVTDRITAGSAPRRVKTFAAAAAGESVQAG